MIDDRAAVPAPEPEPDGRLDTGALPLDPRAIAQASLAADRNLSLWAVAAGVLVSVLVALLAGTPIGALALAFLLACCAVVRAVVRGPGPSALVVRSRGVDVVALGALAVAIGVLSQIVPAPLP